jgi:integrase
MAILAESLMDKLSRHTRAILATGFYAGMRRGEVLCLTRDKVDMEKRMIRLEAEDTKDKKPRVIPILPELYEILKATPRALHDPHVFPYRRCRCASGNRPVRGLFAKC